MGVKTRDSVTSAGVHYAWLVWCPACDEPHQFAAKMPGGGPGWAFDGDHERPTFTPSMRVTLTEPEPPHAVVYTCHSMLTRGVWHYFGDSTHELAGKQVPAPDWPRPRYGGTRPSPGAPTE